MHTTPCIELRKSWLPVTPFGKHRGQPLNAVPVDYLEWIVENLTLSGELLEAIQSTIAEAM
jgi:uncharacterized protein (DUF3820 family)